MEDYLAGFLSGKVAEYRREINSLRLEKTPNLARVIDDIIEANMGLVREGVEGISIPDEATEDIRRAYVLTANLGRDLAKFLFGTSRFHFRMGEDYAEIYAEIMSIFGSDKTVERQRMLDLLAKYVRMDRLIRSAMDRNAPALLN